MAALDTTVEEHDGRVHVLLRGDLDIATGPMLARAIGKATSGPHETVVLDLSGLEFIDSMGLYTVIEADELARSNGCRLVIVRGPQAVHNTFELTGLEERLEFVDVVDLPG